MARARLMPHMRACYHTRAVVTRYVDYSLTALSAARCSAGMMKMFDAASRFRSAPKDAARRARDARDALRAIIARVS